ncbi:MAG TPA: hypothetical protein VG324_18475 [Blastocatellia bacterium]|nr:hypothetical protein [Blastocatellia bacterium]
MAETNPRRARSIRIGVKPVLMTWPPAPQIIARFLVLASRMAPVIECSVSAASMRGRESSSAAASHASSSVRGLAKSRVVTLLGREASG